MKAKKKGTAIISAVLPKKTLKCKITVEDPKINKTTASVKEGKTITLKIKGTSQKIKWSSKNKGIAKVSSKGVVTGKTAGNVKIVGTVGGKKFICKITVSKNEQNTNGSSTGSRINENSSSSDEVLIDNGDNSSNNTASGMVWIPKSGSKYHSTSTCSGMKNPSHVTLSEAISSGYTACSKCW